MKREENPGGGNEVITLLIVAGGGYLLYAYLQSSGLWAQWFGGASGAVPTFAQIVAGIQAGTFSANIPGGAGTGVVLDKATGQYFQVNTQTQAVTGPITAAQAQAIISAAPGSQPAPVANPPVVVPLTNPNTPAPPSTQANALQSQLQSMGNQFMANMQAAGTPVAGLNVDQWMFYYNQIKGTPLSPAQALTITQAAGVPSSATVIPLSTFMNALGGAGLSGIIGTPNQGPIRNPLPSQNFGGGYGGYGNRGRRGYIN